MGVAEKICDLLVPLAPTALELKDDSHRHAGHAGATSGGGHYELKVVSSSFSGKSRVNRHREIYALLSALIPGEIHALSISALTPEECSTQGI